MGEVCMRNARLTDLPCIEQMLLNESLPIAGVAEHLTTFLVAERDNAIIGAMGLELYGDTALLRSAVVIAHEKGAGIGGELYDAIFATATSMNITRLLLLTNTAEEYFRRRGFRKIPQESVTGPVTSSVEFSGACPSHAACMELIL
ncbi:MAG: arsenic resistance N-acetyltransferase ArsN2 [Bacteroidota bacterium]